MTPIDSIISEEVPLYGKADVSVYQDLSFLVPELPKVEQKLLDFYYTKKMNQKDIAKIIGVTQGAISSRITRAKKRLIYLKELKGINFDKFFKDIEGVIEEPMDFEIIKSIIKTSCQSETARYINDKFNLVDLNMMNQVKVRYRFVRTMNKLRVLGQHSYRFKKYYSILNKIKNNFYMRHEVRLPHFDKRQDTF